MNWTNFFTQVDLGLRQTFAPLANPALVKRRGNRSCDFNIVSSCAWSKLCFPRQNYWRFRPAGATWKLWAPTLNKWSKNRSNSIHREETDLHDFSHRTVGSFWDELDAPQAVRRDDPRLHLQAVAAGVVLPANWRHTCRQLKNISTWKTDWISHKCQFFWLTKHNNQPGLLRNWFI